MDKSPALAVIGTAGRQDDASKLSSLGPNFYESMFERVRDAAIDWQVTHAVSGGAAYADHLAVRGYLEGLFKSLTLYIPASWSNGAFIPNARVQFNPGRTLNRYHADFSASVGIDSLSEVADAIAKGARVEVHPGFQMRNLMVARDATHMIAMTFGMNRPPEDLRPEDDGFSSAATAGLKNGARGQGTAHTWREAYRCTVKRHVSLDWLVQNVSTPPQP